MSMNRRDFVQKCALAGTGAWVGLHHFPTLSGSASSRRAFHASVSIDAFKKDPGLPDIIRGAGVTDVWLACFFQGQWYHPIEEVLEWRDRLRTQGLQVHNITIPLGHPSFSDTVPDYMPGVAANAWKPGYRPDGRKYFGVSLHEGVTESNVKALERIKTTDPGIIFVDDDFRLAPGPGDIGGCFCEEHKQAFLKKHQLTDQDWMTLLGLVEKREFDPLVEAWVEENCDQLTASFRAQQEAAKPEAEMGIMVMFLGCEKAGIRLTDYRGVPFRVGELMFDDHSFAPVKGKTNELFSSLFHRRFVEPDRAFSETTAWPPDGLSAPNMAAKLAISTLSDVRNTMFMSGNTPFPRTHWEVLSPAMKKNAAIHEKTAGQKPSGPLKHFWGKPSRYVGDANPFSLFLALGIPFKVVENLPEEGWTFLSDADAKEVGRSIQPTGAPLVHRPDSGAGFPLGQTLAEDLPALFAWRKTILPELEGTPYVEEEEPVVCAWFREAGQVLLWNLAEQPKEITLRFGKDRRPVHLAPLDLELVEGIG